MRAAAQRLYWALVSEGEDGMSVDFGRLADLAGLSGRSTRNRDVVACLEELKDEGLISYALDLAGATDIAVESSPETQQMMRSVFVVHGHDGLLLAEVDALLLRVGLRPIILRTLPGGGRTIIEKIEDYSTVQFAVCLLTPDDEGCAVGGDVKPRARQNVVLELGYFLGRLGRQRVHVLYRGGVELPSDYHGVEYTATDTPNSDWRVELCKEMRLSGLPVDVGAII